MKKIAITGNIGSGKSSCCSIFEILGYPVYYADQQAKLLMQKEPKVRQKIIRTFGEESYDENGLNRPYLSKRVFGDRDKLKQLNAIVHPAVHKDLQLWIEQQRENGHTAAIEEAALTFEAGHENFFDAIITVVAPQAMLIRRVMKRDRISRELVIERLSQQWPQEFKCRHSKGVILNDGQHSLIFQVKNIVERWSI